MARDWKRGKQNTSIVWIVLMAAVLSAFFYFVKTM
jgi:hypothetical protein